MTSPAFARFRPVPVRGRHDGWSPDLQRRFILLLATGASPGEAARRLGRSRQTAYALRRRAGGEGFSAAWDAAADFARRARVAGRSVPPGEYGFDTIFVPRFYRGRLVGFVQREDHQSALRTLAKLDRAAQAHGGDFGGIDFEALLDELDPEGAASAKADKADGIPL